MTVKRRGTGVPAVFWRPAIRRPAKFALVGALGIVVQLADPRSRSLPLVCQYLWATGLAVEAAVLHNFMWHRRFTWRDRGACRNGVQLSAFPR